MRLHLASLSSGYGVDFEAVLTVAENLMCCHAMRGSCIFRSGKVQAWSLLRSFNHAWGGFQAVRSCSINYGFLILKDFNLFEPIVVSVPCLNIGGGMTGLHMSEEMRMHNLSIA